MKQFHFGLGRRKRAVARVKVTAGSGKYQLNNKELPMPELISSIFSLAGQSVGGFDVAVTVNGGGITGWRDAISLGVSRAIIAYHPTARSALKSATLLTRDPREKERKKYGLKRARRAPQFSKR